MPYTHDEEKAEEQKRADGFLSKSERHSLVIEWAIVICLAGLVVAFGVSLLAR